jgi:hypothetical protein
LTPGTELAFATEVACSPAGLLNWRSKPINYRTAIFRQVNKEKPSSKCGYWPLMKDSNYRLTIIAVPILA